MLKNFLENNEAQILSKNEQKAINGGIPAGCCAGWLDLDGPCGGTDQDWTYYVMEGRPYCCIDNASFPPNSLRHCPMG